MAVVRLYIVFFFFQAEDGIRDHCVTGVQTCALPIFHGFQAAADSAHFSVARDCDWRDGHFRRLVRRVCFRMDRRDMASDSPRSAGVCGTVCAVSSELAGRPVDRGGRYWDFYRSNAIARARGGAAVGGGKPALWV